MKRQIIIASSIVGVFILLLAGIKFIQIMLAMSNQFQPPPEAVTAATVRDVAWPRTLHAIGNIYPVSGAELKAEESGRVTAIHFESGSFVEAGVTLLELDSSVEEAELRGAVALVEKNKQAFDRAKSLLEKKATSETNYENAAWGYHDAVAKVAALKATIARKRIVAPFSGYTGIRSVNLGQYLTPGAPIVPLHSLTSLYVDFSLPERAVANVSVNNLVEVTVDAFPNSTWHGKVQALDPVIDEPTRNVRVRALLENSTERLRPGMFADITLVLPEIDNFLAVPASSIVYAPYGNSVFVVEPSKEASSPTTVRQQIVKTGPARGDLVAILSGLKTADLVVTSGGFKLRPGLAVMVNESIRPGDTIDPQPTDT